MLLDVALSIETSRLLKTSWFSSGTIKGLLFMHPFIFKDPRHGAGMASIMAIRLKMSLGEKSHCRRLLLLINWLLSVTKSTILINPLPFNLELNIDLPSMQMNLLFHITVLDISSGDSSISLLRATAEHCVKHLKHSG